MMTNIIILWQLAIMYEKAEYKLTCTACNNIKFK